MDNSKSQNWKDEYQLYFGTKLSSSEINDEENEKNISEGKYFEELFRYRKENKIEEFYNKYASHYENILCRTHLVYIQEYAVGVLKDYLCEGIRSDTQSAVNTYRILDIGCGTGHTGVILKQMGFGEIDGLDGSVKMIDEASKKNVYTTLMNEMVSKENPIPSADNSYDAVLCIYGIMKGQMEFEPTLEEFFRIVKSGGYAVFTISPSLDPNDYMVSLARYMSRGDCELKLLVDKEYWNNNLHFNSHICVVKVK